MIYLLDSNVWIAFLRQPGSPVVSRLQAKPPGEIRVCSVVVAELRYGCLRSAKPVANRAAVQGLLAPYLSLPFDDTAADQFATIRRHLECLARALVLTTCKSPPSPWPAAARW